MRIRWWSVAIFLLAFLTMYIGMAFYLMPPATMLAVVAEYFGAAVVAVALAMAPYGRATFGLLGFRSVGWRPLLGRTVGLVAVSKAIWLLYPEAEWVQEAIEMVRQPGQLVVCLVLLGILAPLAEELVFRGVLYGWIEGRWGSRVAVVASAIAVAAVHWQPARSAVALLIALLLGWLRWRSNSLLTPLIAHVINNVAFVLAARYLLAI